MIEYDKSRYEHSDLAKIFKKSTSNVNMNKKKLEQKVYRNDKEQKGS